MAYCPNCGEGSQHPLDETYSRRGVWYKCTACRYTAFIKDARPSIRPGANALSDDTTPASPIPAADNYSALGLHDVPRWLGWLAIPIGVVTLVVGLGIYVYWAYRRGRRDGVGRAATDPPYENMGWRTVGWGVALFVPLLSWFAAVHLPTLWYKHGLRVGAKEGTASQRFSSLPAVIGVAATPVVSSVVGLILLGLAISGTLGGLTSAFGSGDDDPSCLYYSYGECQRNISP